MKGVKFQILEEELCSLIGFVWLFQGEEYIEEDVQEEVVHQSVEEVHQTAEEVFEDTEQIIEGEGEQMEEVVDGDKELSADN